jgi:hypothetical protein
LHDRTRVDRAVDLVAWLAARDAVHLRRWFLGARLITDASGWRARPDGDHKTVDEPVAARVSES